MTVLK